MKKNTHSNRGRKLFAILLPMLLTPSLLQAQCDQQGKVQEYNQKGQQGGSCAQGYFHIANYYANLCQCEYEMPDEDRERLVATINFGKELIDREFGTCGSVKKVTVAQCKGMVKSGGSAGEGGVPKKSALSEANDLAANIGGALQASDDKDVRELGSSMSKTGKAFDIARAYEQNPSQNSPYWDKIEAGVQIFNLGKFLYKKLKDSGNLSGSGRSGSQDGYAELEFPPVEFTLLKQEHSKLASGLPEAYLKVKPESYPELSSYLGVFNSWQELFTFGFSSGRILDNGKTRISKSIKLNNRDVDNFRYDTDVYLSKPILSEAQYRFSSARGINYKAGLWIKHFEQNMNDLLYTDLKHTAFVGLQKKATGNEKYTVDVHVAKFRVRMNGYLFLVPSCIVGTCVGLPTDIQSARCTLAFDVKDASGKTIFTKSYSDKRWKYITFWTLKNGQIGRFVKRDKRCREDALEKVMHNIMDQFKQDLDKLALQ